MTDKGDPREARAQILDYWVEVIHNGPGVVTRVQKAMMAQIGAGTGGGGLHHIISTGAALLSWHRVASKRLNG